MSSSVLRLAGVLAVQLALVASTVGPVAAVGDVRPAGAAPSTGAAEAVVADQTIAVASERLDRELLTVPVTGGSKDARTLLPSELDEADAVWSPDGTRVAFSRSGERGDPSAGIYVGASDGSQVRRVTPEDGRHYTDPDWSPDGRVLVFEGTAGAGSDRGVWTAPADGSERPVLRTKVAGTRSTAPSWSPDGTWIAYAHEDGRRSGVYRLRADRDGPVDATGDPVAVTGWPGPVELTWDPASSQSARQRLVFSLPTGAGQARQQLCLADVGGEYGVAVAESRSCGDGARRIQPYGGDARDPVWSAAGFAFVSRHENGSTVRVVRGGDPEAHYDLVVALPWAVHATALSGDGLLAFDTRLPGGRIHLVGADGRGHRELGLPGLLDPAWSPDGRSLAVTSRGADGRRHLAVVRPDGGGLSDLTGTTLPGSDIASPRWSPDGSEIVVLLRQSSSAGVGTSGLAVVSARTGELLRWLTHDPTDADPEWSPDGRLIAFSRDAGEERQVFVLPSGGGEPSARIQGARPVWHPRAPSLTAVDGLRVVSLPSEGGEPGTVLEVDANRGLGYSPDGVHLAYTAFRGDELASYDHLVVHTFGDPGSVTTVLEDGGPYGRPSWRPSAGLDLAYATDRPSAGVGEDVRWTATVTNRGPSPLRRATLTLHPPAGAEVHHVEGDADCAPGSTGPATDEPLTCTVGPLARQASATVVLTIPALPGLNRSQAELGDGGDPVDPRTGRRTAEAQVVGVFPELTLSKTADVERVPLGDVVTYRLEVGNAGGQVAREAVLVDQLPREMSLEDVAVEPASGAECQTSGRRLECEIRALEPDDEEGSEDVVVVLSGRVDRMPRNADASITNTATVTLVDDRGPSSDADDGSEPDGPDPEEPAGASATASATVHVDRPELRLEAAADPAQVGLGDDSVVELDVTNTGRAPARDTEVQVSIPDGLDVQAAPGCTQRGGELACRLGTLKGGARAVRVITVRGEDVGPQRIAAQVLTASPGDEPSGNTAAVELLVVAPDLVVDKRGPGGPVPVGDLVMYVLDVHNRGTAAAEGVRLVDPLAAGLELVAVRPASLCRQDARGVVCELGTVEASAGARVEVTARATDVGNVRNTATVSSTTRQTRTDNDTGEADVEVLPPDLTVSVAGASDVGVGADVPVTVSVDNSGAAGADDVTVSASWDREVLELVGAPSGCSPSEDGSRVQCRLGTIAPRRTAQAVLVVRALVTGPTAIAVSTNTATPEQDQDDNSAELSFTVRSPRLQVDLTGPATVEAGDDIAYDAVVSNDGDWPAVDVRLRDVLPAGTELAGGDERCALAARTVTCAVGSLEPAESRTVRVVLRAPAPGVVVNRVTAGGAAGRTDEATSPEVRTRVLAADLAVSLSASPEVVALDGTTTVTAVVSSAGPESTGGVVLTLPLPTGTGLRRRAPDRCDLAGRVLTCVLGELEPGQDRTVTVALTALAVGRLPVEVHVAGDVVDLVPGNDRATARLVVEPNAGKRGTTTPSLVVSPSQGYAGFVVQARGEGFPARTVVRLRWTPGIVPPVAGGVVTTDSDGRFTASVVLAPNDVLGLRRLVAQVDGGPQVEVPFLLGRSPVQPPLPDGAGGPA